MRRERPPSAVAGPPGANAFSISSIQRTHGASASAVAIAWRRLRSVSPTHLS